MNLLKKKLFIFVYLFVVFIYFAAGAIKKLSVCYKVNAQNNGTRAEDFNILYLIVNIFIIYHMQKYISYENQKNTFPS